jgi:simple sugar transport system permease protein
MSAEILQKDNKLTSVDSPLQSFLRERWRELLAGSIFIAFYLLFVSICPGFGSQRMMSVILMHGAELGIMTIGPTLLIMCGEMDLSVASVYAFAVFLMFSLANLGVPVIFAIVLALAYGAVAGAINGLLTLRFNVASFIATFGTLVFWRTALAGLSDGDATYLEVSNAIIVSLFGGTVGIIPKQFLWFLILAAVFSMMLNRSRFGNHVMATGGNARTARGMGVDTERTKWLCFIISSTLAAFSGVMIAARLTYVDPVLALGMEFEAVASAVIGGTVLTGGLGSIAATSIGAFLLKLIQHGVSAFGVKVEYFRVVIGLLLLICAVVSTHMTRRVFGLRG